MSHEIWDIFTCVISTALYFIKWPHKGWTLRKQRRDKKGETEINRQIQMGKG